MVSGLSSGIASSLPSGIETPDTMLNLRKGTDSAVPALYTVLEQKQTNVAQGSLMGSDHVYVLPDQAKKDKKRWGQQQGRCLSGGEGGAGRGRGERAGGEGGCCS